MMTGDRIFGAVVVLGALVFIASASQIALPFFSDPLGPRVFPILIGVSAFLCGVVMVWRPDAEADWPAWRTVGALAVAALVLAAYAYALKPLGFLIPTAIAAGVLSYQISPRPRYAVLAGLGLSIGLLVVFKYVLGLGLVPVPRAWYQSAPPPITAPVTPDGAATGTGESD